MEKASLEKIRRLLEISEHERHYEVLLTPKNLVDVRRNPAPYSLPIIPRPLPSEIVDREHFVTANLLNLIAGSGSSSKVPNAETSSRELVSRDHPLLPVGVPVLLNRRLAREKGVTARKAFRYQER